MFKAPQSDHAVEHCMCLLCFTAPAPLHSSWRFIPHLHRIAVPVRVCPILNPSSNSSATLIVAMAMLGASTSLSSQLCSVSGRTPAVSAQPQLQVPGAFPLKRSGGRGVVCVRARGSGGDPESKQLLDAFFLGKALAETVSERIGSLVGELLSEVGQRQAEQQRRIREFQNEVQERAKTSATKAAQKALATEYTVPRAAATQPSTVTTQSSTVTYDDEPRNGSTVTESTTSVTEGANGLPSLPYDDLPPLDPPSPPSTRPSPSSEQGAPDF